MTLHSNEGLRQRAVRPQRREVVASEKGGRRSRNVPGSLGPSSRIPTERTTARKLKGRAVQARHTAALPDPTDRQLEILTWISDFIRINEWAPTLREMMDEFRIGSTNAMRDHLVALERKLLIERQPRRAGAIRITRAGKQWLGARVAA